ncbi:unnamed protein product [Soboliphyme baturini]|uniref:Guanylate kinase-like domain-containing protein n=1 Tax=Soboliphyme baturini TaxID=241478 RepID=A0A183J4V3_9BILA|nr:unnamed protein product [Soboliphyme baturini]
MRESDKDSKIEQVEFYEEVVRATPYGRRVLVLLGAKGVGRRTLKSQLIKHDPVHFAMVVPYTSRSPHDGEQEGREYHFLKREKMKEDIDAGVYMEWGEYNGNFYGTTFRLLKLQVDGHFAASGMGSRGSSMGA